MTILNRLGLPFFFTDIENGKCFFRDTLLFDIHLCHVFICMEYTYRRKFHKTDEVILEFLESKHIKHGMLKKESEL